MLGSNNLLIGILNIMINDFKVIFDNLNNSDKLSLLAIVLMSVFASFFEVLGLGSVVFVILFALNEEYISSSGLIELLGFFSIEIEPTNQKNYFLSAFLIIILTSYVFRYFYIYYQSRKLFGFSARFSTALFQKNLEKSYAYFQNTNYIEKVSLLTVRMNLFIHNIMLTFIIFVNAIILTVAIGIILMVANAAITSLIMLSIGIITLLFHLTMKNQLIDLGENINSSIMRLQKIASSSLKNFLALKVNGFEPQYVKNFELEEHSVRNAQRMHFMITHTPRLVIEAVSLFLILAAAVYLFTNHEVEYAIATLTLVGLSFQKLLPVIQQVYVSYATIKGYAPILKEMAEEYQNSSADRLVSNVKFINPSAALSVEIEKVILPTFTQNLTVINGIYSSGEVIQISGPSGVGKSTLFTVLTGMANPTSGVIKISGLKESSWRSELFVLTQDTFLTDSSIIDNITFGTQFCSSELNQICEKLDLIPLLGQFDNRNLTIGEQGVKLSGGQQQRIALARALIRRPKILLLDEATNALDKNTQKVVFELIRIYVPESITFFISHDENTNIYADKIVSCG